MSRVAEPVHFWLARAPDFKIPYGADSWLKLFSFSASIPSFEAAKKEKEEKSALSPAKNVRLRTLLGS